MTSGKIDCDIHFVRNIGTYLDSSASFLATIDSC